MKSSGGEMKSSGGEKSTQSEALTQVIWSAQWFAQLQTNSVCTFHHVSTFTSERHLPANLKPPTEMAHLTDDINVQHSIKEAVCANTFKYLDVQCEHCQQLWCECSQTLRDHDNTKMELKAALNRNTELEWQLQWQDKAQLGKTGSDQVVQVQHEKTVMECAELKGQFQNVMIYVYQFDDAFDQTQQLMKSTKEAPVLRLWLEAVERTVTQLQEAVQHHAEELQWGNKVIAQFRGYFQETCFGYNEARQQWKKSQEWEALLKSLLMKAVMYIVRYTWEVSKDSVDGSCPQAECTLHDTKLECCQLEDAYRDKRQQLIYIEVYFKQLMHEQHGIRVFHFWI